MKVLKLMGPFLSAGMATIGIIQLIQGNAIQGILSIILAQTTYLFCRKIGDV